MEEFENQNQTPLSVKDWLVTMLVMAIPLVGFVMLFVYAFGDNQNENRQNWAKAQLIMMAVVIAFIILMLVVFGGIFAAAMGGSN